MNEKVNEILKTFYDSLTDEQKEKAKVCKNTDDVLKFAGEEGIELPDEALNMVSGGCGEESQEPLPSCDKCTEGPKCFSCPTAWGKVFRSK